MLGFGAIAELPIAASGDGAAPFPYSAYWLLNPSATQIVDASESRILTLAPLAQAVTLSPDVISRTLEPSAQIVSLTPPAQRIWS